VALFVNYRSEGSWYLWLAQQIGLGSLVHLHVSSTYLFFVVVQR
jgi:hypothetical protein